MASFGIPRRELLIALLAALLLAAWPLRRALVQGDGVLFGLEGASSFLPWSAVLEPAPVENPDLADQSVQFYPFYRWVSKSWRAGDPPLWCPLIYAGAPGLGNAQSGALDPQVLALVALDALGGRALFDRGLTLMAWLRLALALLGAYLLARRLGLQWQGAGLAAISFGFSGYLVLWLNHALGHVPPFLPWVLFFLEGLRRNPRPWLNCALVGASMALAVLGGHLETGFFVGVASGLWCLAILREERSAGAWGLLGLALGSAVAAVILLPSLEYLNLSAAKYVREIGAAQARANVDLAALGVLCILVGSVVAFRRAARDWGAETRLGEWLPGALGLGLAFGGGLRFLASRGLGEHAGLALLPDLFGKPGAQGGYLGTGYYLEVASPWIVFPGLLLAMVALLAASGHLARRTLVSLIALFSFGLCIELPGLLELYRFVPLVGLGDTVRFASVGALMLGLLAGEGLERSSRAARVAAAMIFLPLLSSFFIGGGLGELAPEVDRSPERDELIGLVLAPAEELHGERSELEAWLHPALGVDRVRLVMEQRDLAGAALPGTRFEMPLSLYPEPSIAARERMAGEQPEPGARWVRSGPIPTDELADGYWDFRLEFFKGLSQEPVATRRVGIRSVQRGHSVAGSTMLWIALSLVLMFLPWSARAGGVLLILLALLQAFDFCAGLNPTVPRERIFPPTRSVEILSGELGSGRFFSDPGVLPPNTGLVSGLRGIAGYDAMDVLEFNLYRNLIFPPGFNSLHNWNARGVDTRNAAFRLYGVKLLVLAEPFGQPGWELLASPSGEGPMGRAETWIYRALDPIPRAFCVPEVVSTEQLAQLHQADPIAWDPRQIAAIDADWRPEQPVQAAQVEILRSGNNEVQLSARLDGDGLLVLTDQYFPGWQVYVNGERRTLEKTNLIFRGVALEAGEHEVVFRFESKSVQRGALISIAALLALMGLAVFGLFFGGARTAAD